MAQHPKVIACGHKHITVKTGNSFPAFLVQLPATSRRHDDASSNHCCFFWRTKRDFLLLNRALQKCNAAKSFPKSAFGKLCNRAVSDGPWIRSDDNDYCESIRVLLNACNREDSHSIECNFDPRLKKSLHLLDSFLCHVHDLYLVGVNARVKDANTDPSAATLKEMVDAWSLFCREKDTDGLFIPKPNHSEIVNDEKGSNDPKMNISAARLGQYFASDENAKDVVRTTLQLIRELGHDNKQLIFVEPSCGDGRIVQELLSSQSPLLDSAQIAAYDIDSSAIERSIQKFRGFTMPSNVENDPVFRCSNFLSLTRRDLLQDLELLDESNTLTVVFGGPPYTPKELPEQFILHSIHEMYAEIVVFILPARCKKDAVRVHEALNQRKFSGAAGQWQFINKELVNIDFDFEGMIVMQPSILQCWTLKR